MPLRTLRRQYIAFQVAASLREAVLAGEWRTHLPSERVIANLFKVSRMTVRKALLELEGERIIAPNSRNSVRRILDHPGAPATTVQPVVTIVTQSEAFDPGILGSWQHHLELQLAQRGIRCEIIYFPDRHINSQHSGPRNWLTAHPNRVWMLLEASRQMQLWFARFAPRHTLVLGSSYPETGLPSIDRDYRAVGRHAAGLLLGRNHRAIAFLRFKKAVAGDQETEEGFRAALAASPEAKLHVASHDGTRENIHRQLNIILKIRPRITAVFMYKTRVALALVTRLLKVGIRIPEDLSVIARDESPYFETLPFDLAHYRIRQPDIANHAIAQIESSLGPKPTSFTSVRILPQFQQGNSVSIM